MLAWETDMDLDVSLTAVLRFRALLEVLKRKFKLNAKLHLFISQRVIVLFSTFVHV